MGKSAQLVSAGEQVMGDLLTGTPASTTIKKLTGATGIAVNEPALKKAVPEAAAAAARQVKPTAGTTVLEAVGQAAQAEVKKLAAVTGSEAELKKAAKASLDASTHLGSPAVARQLIAMAAEESSRAVINAAMKNLEKEIPGLEALLKPIWSDLLGHGDTEGLASAIAKRAVQDSTLTKAQAERFLRAVHDLLCDDIVAQMELLLKQPEILTEIRSALAALRQPGQSIPELGPLFRQRVRAIVADQAGMLLARVVDQLTDPATRRDFLERLFKTMCDRYAGAMIAAHFDAAGMRSVLTALYSFRKNYSTTSRLKAMENLIGWMYESSRFTSEAMAGEASTAGAQLSNLLKTQYKALGLTSTGTILMHTDVNALGRTGLRQATDMMATVPITLGEGANTRTVHVVLAALEAKGERGVLSGIRQVIEKLLQRFKRGAPVTTEHMNFTMGKDLFLSIEDALLSLNVNPTKAREIAAGARSGLDRYRAFVVSPLPKDVALKQFGTSFGEGAKAADKITYLQHPIPRSSMVAIVQGLASVFGLGPPP